ncbi:prepilin peptidase [Clostridium felsineum]|uniref:prepilin peptidase n=1 Tax=Clostridium felsineum TaxID=36839 RepID=UPI00098BE437|nr:A24 family peptidase [Clostridium felsineum]URZ15155.1 Type 4 prepilin-like proteins leader peptide-processing enzyme [Clostridium felsineum DSM 794]
MTIIIFVIGIIIGSFLNVCTIRIPKGESIIYPPSHCTKCGKKLKWYDMMPILSYIIIKGRCRYCNEKIGFRYFGFEILCGTIFLMLYLKYGYNLITLKYIALFSVLFIISVIDFDTQVVYLCTTLPGILVGVIFMVINLFYKNSIHEYLFAAILYSGIIVLINFAGKAFIKKTVFGMGDAEVIFMCGLFLGMKFSMLMLFMTIILAGAVSMILMLLKLKSKTDYVAFVPFIAIASMVTVLYGQNILNFYNNFFLL